MLVAQCPAPCAGVLASWESVRAQQGPLARASLAQAELQRAALCSLLFCPAAVQAAHGEPEQQRRGAVAV